MKTITKLKNLIIILMPFLIFGCTTNAHKNEPSKAFQATTLPYLEEFIRFKSIGKATGTHEQNLPIEIKDSIVPKEASLLTKTNPTKKAMERKYNINAKNVSAKSFFLSLIEDTKYNVIIHPRVTGVLSLQLKNVTMVEILNSVRDVFGYDYRIHENNNNIEILPAEIQIKEFIVNYLDVDRTGNSNTTVSLGKSSSSGSSSSSSGNAISTSFKSNFWQELKETITTIIGTEPNKKVAISPLSGSVIVQALPNELRVVEEYLKNAQEKLSKQVILEAKILEVELNDNSQNGINWALLSGRLQAMQAGSNKVSSLNPKSLLSSSLKDGSTFSPFTSNTPVGLLNNEGTFGGVLSLSLKYSHLASFVELLDAQGKVKVLSSPRVATTNNQKAIIKVGQEEYFVTNIGSTSIETTSTSSASTQSTVDFELFFSGISLEVTPLIGQNDYVTLHVHPNISSVTTSNKSITVENSTTVYPLALNSIREADSIISAKNGHLVVIGGLMQEQKTNADAGIPGLKNLPGLGKLFSQSKQTAKKVELVILIRPIIVEKNNYWNTILEDTVNSFNS